MFQCVQAGQDRLLESSLHIFAEIITMGVPEALLQHLDSLHAVLGQCMGSQNAEVRLSALRACSYFIRELEKPAHRNKFQDLIPHMLRCLEAALQSGDENDAQAALEMFIDVGENQPRFLRKQLVPVSCRITEDAPKKLRLRATIRWLLSIWRLLSSSILTIRS